MCGIAGFWRTKRGSEHLEETLAHMGRALAHRGPDDSGSFYDAATGIALVHRRLSILDLSPEGHQPMVSRSGRYTIVFNGEVYNFEEIRAELGKENWRGHSDTEVMLAAIERWGLDAAIQRFVGMFAFALWDPQQNKLHLVRDRVGIKPLFYGHVDGAFVFASELKAIREYPGFKGRIDRNALALYMRHNYVPSPHCIYEGIYKLPPGCVLTLSTADEKPVARRFWSAEDVSREGTAAPLEISDEEAIAQLEKWLLSVIGSHMIADVPLGVFLSGGIDSSTVAAVMQAQSSRPVKTFTIGFHEAEYNEAAHARKIAAYLGTEHTELYLTPQDALDVVPLLPEMYDEPFADASQIPTYLISKLARRSVTVSLSGDGGDELFGGYNRYLFTRRLWRSINLLPRSARGVAAQLLQAIPPATIDSIAHLLQRVTPHGLQFNTPGEKTQKLASYLTSGDPETIYLRTLSHWSDPGQVVLNAVEPDTVRQSLKDARRLPNLEEAMMLTDQRYYLPDDILTKVDRASMAVSLEARVPYLDHRLVEFSWKLPLNLKIRDGVGKWILRQVLYKYVPARLVERPKMGFELPIDRWLRGPLRQWAENLLSMESLKRHGLFAPEAVRTKWQEHLSGSRNWQHPLWDVLIFQDWFFKTSHSPAHDSSFASYG
jgi:asparagine synthase (glutamine-hydrolysing)